MKKLYAPFSFFLVLWLGCILTVSAQNFSLVKDINTNKDANPQNPKSKNGDSSFAVVNNTVYFSANDGVHGNELWRSDGTNTGTKLVKDINPGNAASSVQNIVRLKDNIIFSATDGTGVLGIWTSDGTEAGTKLLSYMPKGLYNSVSPAFFTLVNDSIMYFAANNNFIFDELWKTDGTVAGTKAVKTFSTMPGNYGSDAENFTSFNNKLFFTLEDKNGYELWSSDGTEDGTKLYKDIWPGMFNSHPRSLTVVDSTLLFFATDDGLSNKLWRTQGDPADLQSISFQNSFEGIDNLPFLSLEGAIYFEHGNGMCRYKPGTSTGIEYITGSYTSFSYTLAGKKIIYGNSGKLWGYDGTGTPTVIKDVNVTNIKSIGTASNFYFIANGGGAQLWKSDGTTAGTVLVKGGFPQTNSNQPSCLTVVNGNLLFAADDGYTGKELWISDGSAAGTTLLKDINQFTSGNADPDLYTKGGHIVNSNNQLLFYATTRQYGTELYTTDGTTGGTKMLKDILPGAANGMGSVGPLGYAGPTLFTNFKNESYFFAQSADTTLWAWKTDGTAGGTQPADSFTSKSGSYKSQALNLLAGKNTIYYYVTYGRGEIYASNGNSTKHLVLGDINLQTTQNLCTVGDTLFFDYWDTNGDTEKGIELWMTDGTAGNTKMVKDINTTGVFGSSNPSNFFAYKGRLYFTANDGNGNYLWTSNGIETGTQLLKKIIVAAAPQYNSPAALIQSYIISGGKLFFIANDSIAGNELWVTDGTTNGTVLVKDIYPGKNTSAIYNMVDVNGTLFFVANDGVHGTELWKSNGTAAGTVMVKDITTGTANTYIYYPVASNGLLYFYNGNNSIWQSDGTANGTKIVDDLALSGLNSFAGLVNINGNLIVSATSYQYGSELYSATVATLPVTLLSFTGSLVKADAQLTWKTANEINNDYFNVQRSFDGAGFSNIGKVTAAGNTVAEHTYKLTDADVTNLGANTLYYRLQQVDKDGKSTYSNIVKLNVNNIDIAVGPNPARNIVYVRSSVNINNAAITIADMNGRVLYTTKQHLQAGVQAPVNVSALAAGTYNITIQTANTPAKQYKVVIQ